jgi:ABC-type spermidine/putrescine transport system permease subunit II
MLLNLISSIVIAFVLYIFASVLGSVASILFNAIMPRVVEYCIKHPRLAESIYVSFAIVGFFVMVFFRR